MIKKIQDRQRIKMPIIFTVLFLCVALIGFIASNSDMRDILIKKITSACLPITLVTPTSIATNPDEGEKYTLRKMIGRIDGDSLKYKSDTLGIEFQLPNTEEFLTLNEKKDKKPTDPRHEYASQNYCITDSDNFSVICPINQFTISTFTGDLKGKRGFSFSDLTGFSKTGSEFRAYRIYDDGPGEGTITDARYLKNTSGVSILKVLGESEYAPEEIEVWGHPKEGYVGAIVNLPNNPFYTGFNIQMKLTDTLTEKVFDQILDSIKIVR